MSICNIAQRFNYIFVQNAKEHFWDLYRYIFINTFVSINLYRYFFIKCSPTTIASGEFKNRITGMERICFCYLLLA